MLRNALATTLVMVAVACGAVTDTSPSTVDPSVAVSMPSPRLPGLHRTPGTGVLSSEEASLDAEHPGPMQALLDGAGFLGATEETYSGSPSTFSRVVIRGWRFASADGAGAFLDWLRVNGTHELIGEAVPMSSDALGSVSLFVHEPSGCCHEEVPIYLAAWQRGATVWTIRASGPHIHTPPVLALISKVEQEV
jgi:hypothetical protein